MPDNDLLTVDETESYLNVASKTKTDDEVQRFITATSKRLDEKCGPIVIRTVTGETHDGGCRYLKLRQAPVDTFTSVVEYAGTTPTTLTPETPGTAPTNGYLWDSRTELLYRRANGNDWAFARGRQNIVLTYEAGRVADTASVPENFKQCALMIIGHLWRTERGQGNMTFGSDIEAGLVPGFGFAIPRRALELIADQIRGPVIV